MATFGTRRLQRKSISCQRARRTIKAIETYLGRTISSDTGYHTPSEKTPATEQWSHIMEHVWTKPTDGSYYFKKAHAISYAVAVVVHMNLLCEDLERNNNGLGSV